MLSPEVFNRIFNLEVEDKTLNTKDNGLEINFGKLS